MFIFCHFCHIINVIFDFDLYSHPQAKMPTTKRPKQQMANFYTKTKATTKLN